MSTKNYLGAFSEARGWAKIIGTCLTCLILLAVIISIMGLSASDVAFSLSKLLPLTLFFMVLILTGLTANSLIRYGVAISKAESKKEAQHEDLLNIARWQNRFFRWMSLTLSIGVVLLAFILIAIIPILPPIANAN